MRDVWPTIAHWLARPSETRPRLHQLWRADVAALGRLAQTCADAADAVRHYAALLARERARRERVRRAREFLREHIAVSMLPASRRWADRFGRWYTMRVDVAFNGRICLREHRVSRRGRRAPALIFYASVTFDDDGGGGGRILCAHASPMSAESMFFVRFEDRTGALCALRFYTYGGQHWRDTRADESAGLPRAYGRWVRRLGLL